MYSFPDTPDTYVVTWSTLNFTLTEAHFGLSQSSLTTNVTGTSFIFEDGGEEKRSQYIHVVKLQPLEPDTQYCKIKNIHFLMEVCIGLCKGRFSLDSV